MAGPRETAMYGGLTTIKDWESERGRLRMVRSLLAVVSSTRCIKYLPQDLFEVMGDDYYDPLTFDEHGTPSISNMTGTLMYQHVHFFHQRILETEL